MDYNNNNFNSQSLQPSYGPEQRRYHNNYSQPQNQFNFDLLLVCENGRVQKCHQTMLSVWSPYFERMFYNINNNIRLPPGQIFVVVMRGVTEKELQCIFKYIYNGEVILEGPDDFLPLLKLAKEWEIKGLSEALIHKMQTITQGMQQMMVPPYPKPPPGFNLSPVMNNFSQPQLQYKAPPPPPPLPPPRAPMYPQQMQMHQPRSQVLPNPPPEEVIVEEADIDQTVQSDDTNMNVLMKQFDSLLATDDLEENCDEFWSPGKSLDGCESVLENSLLSPTEYKAYDHSSIFSTPVHGYSEIQQDDVQSLPCSTSTPISNGEERKKGSVSRCLFRTQSVSNMQQLSYAEMVKHLPAETKAVVKPNDDLKLADINRIRKKYYHQKDSVLESMVERGIVLETRNPKALLNDIMHGTVKYRFRNIVRSGKKAVECTAIIDGCEFKGVGPTEIDSKANAAQHLLDIVFNIKFENGKFVNHTMDIARQFAVTMQEIREPYLADIFEKLVLTKYNEVVKVASRFKTIAAIIVTSDDQVSTAQVIAFGTGAKCAINWTSHQDGDFLINCHAQVIVRRALIRCFYTELIGFNPDRPANLFIQSDRAKFRLKPNLKFHLYISSFPCGKVDQLSEIKNCSTNVTIGHVSIHHFHN